MKIKHLPLTITLEEVREEQKQKLEKACAGLQKCFPHIQTDTVNIKKK